MKLRTLALVSTALFLLALALRAWGLNRSSLWLDEGATVHFAEQTLWSIWRDGFTHEPNPPLYYSLMHFWIRLFGDSETALRFPSAFFGALTVPLICLTGRRLYSWKVGLLAATFALSVPIQLQYSQEARGYALFGFLSCLVIYLTPLNLRWRTRAQSGALLLANTLALWTHFFAVFLILAQIVVLTVYSLTVNRRVRIQEGKDDSRSIFGVVLASVLLAAPWYGCLALNFAEFHQQVNWIEIYPHLNPLYFLEFYFGLTGFADDWGAKPWPVLGLLLVLSLGGLAWWGSIKERSTFLWPRSWRPATWMLILWALFSTLLPLGLGLLGPRVFVLRYGLASATALYLLGAYAIIRGLGRRGFWPSLIAIALCQILFTYQFSRTEYKQDWRSAVAHIGQIAPDLPVLVLPKRYMTQVYYDFSVVDYYLRRLPNRSGHTLTYLDKPEDVLNSLSRAHPAWLLMIDWFNDDVMKDNQDWASLEISEKNRFRSVLLLKAEGGHPPP